MIRAVLISIFLAAAVQSHAGKNQRAVQMTSNQNHLQEARASVDKFAHTLDPDWLEAAMENLEDFRWDHEPDDEQRRDARQVALNLWLRLLDLLDRNFDSTFDADDIPPKMVRPPAFPDPSQGALPPGASPSLITDPKVRAEYEQAIAANRAKIRRYRLQIVLRQVDKDLRHDVRHFIVNAYKPIPESREEVKQAIERNVSDEKERADLLKLSLFATK
jgi:hypothetical protein